MRRSERVEVALPSRSFLSCGASIFIFILITTFSILHPVDSNPINRQVGISENVFITVQNDTYGNEQRVCSIDSVTYTDGESIPTASPCEHCICRPPGFACTIISCEYRPGCKALKRSNQCCPEYQCECEKDGKIYQNGEKILDNNNPCEVCYCQGGDVICAVIDCYWRSDCQPRYIENRCCPLYDHCPPPNQPGPMRPTQRPLTTTTTGTTVGWFNLSSSIFASPSTPLAQLEDLSTTTSVAVLVPSIPEKPLENVISPAQEKVTEASIVPVESSSSVASINIIPSSSSELPIPIPEASVEPVKDVLLSQTSESPVTPIQVIVTSEVPVQASSSSDNLIQSQVQEEPISSVAPVESQSQPEVVAVHSSSSPSPPHLTVDAPPPSAPQEDAPSQVVDDSVNLSSSSVLSPSPVDSGSPLTTVISNVVPIIIVATPVQEIHETVPQTTVSDLLSSVNVEQLPVSIQPSSMETSVFVTVTNSDGDSVPDTPPPTVIQPPEPTEVLQPITVLNTNTLEATSSIVISSPSQSQVINPTTTNDVNPSVVPSSNLVVIDNGVVQQNQVTDAPKIDSEIENTPSVAPPNVPIQVDQVVNNSEVEPDREPPTTQQIIPVDISSSSSIVPSPPSLVLEPPSHPFGEGHQNEIVQDLKPQVVAPPAIELQPPVQNEIIPESVIVPVPESSSTSSNIVAGQAETTIKSISESVEVQTVASVIDLISSQQPQSPASDDAVVGEIEQSTVAVVSDDIQQSLFPVVGDGVSNERPTTVQQVPITINTDEEKTTDSSVQSDPAVVVTDIPTQRPDQVNAPNPNLSIISSSSSSSEVLNDQTEPTIVQDVPVQVIENVETATNAQPSSSSQVVHDDSQSGEPVVEVTDSVPVFVETPDTIKATQEYPVETSSNEANIPNTVSHVIVSDDVTEVEVDLLQSSTVPSTESAVSVSFSDVNDANAVTATGDQLDSQDQSDPTSDNENTIVQDSVVVTTTQKFIEQEQAVQNDQSVSDSSSSAEQTLSEVVTTTISSSSVASASADNKVQVLPSSSASLIVATEIVDKVNDEPATTVLSVQSEEPVIVDDVPETVESTTINISISEKDKLANVETEVLSDDSHASNGVEPEVESTVVAQVQQKPSSSLINEDEPVATTTSASNSVVIASQTNVQFDESPSQNEETTTLRLTIVEDVAQNDEPEAVTTQLPVVVQDESVVETVTLKSDLNGVSVGSSESKFRLDPSVFNEIESASKEQQGAVAGHDVHASSSNSHPSLPLVSPTLSFSLSDSNNNENAENPTTIVSISQSSVDTVLDVENESPIFDNVPTPSSLDQVEAVIKSESNVKSNDANIVADEAEQGGVTTEINRRIIQNLPDQQDAIELTTAGNFLGEERKDLDSEESTSLKSVLKTQGQQIKNDNIQESQVTSQDEKVNDESVVGTTLATLLLRHHHPDHEGSLIEDNETTRLPQQIQNDEIAQDNLNNAQQTQSQDDVQATTITLDSQDEPSATTIRLKHDFRSGLDSNEVNVLSNNENDEQVQTSTSTGFKVNTIQSLDGVNVNEDSVADAAAATTEVINSPSVVKTETEVQQDESVGTTVVVPGDIVQNDDPVIQTTFVPVFIRQDEVDDTIESVTELNESKVNETNVKINDVERVVVIPSELVKKLDPITDDLGQNGLGRSDLSLQSQMKDEINSADETWMWRAVNRIRRLGTDFLPVLRRQPRSAPSTKPELFKPNKTKKATQAQPKQKKYMAHRPFLFW